MRDQGVQLSRLQAAMRSERTRGAALTAAKAQLRGEAQASDLLAFVGISSHPSRGTLRSALRASWFPTGDALAALERDERVVLRFVLGKAAVDPAVGTFTEQARRARRAPAAGAPLLTRTRAQDALRLHELRSAAVAAEMAMYGDIVLVDHPEAPGDLSGKTLALLEAAVLGFDAAFVVKADDDVWLSPGALAAALRARRHDDRLYLGCLRAGSPLRFAGSAAAHLAVGQALQFADPEPSVLPYAAGQLYALSRPLALHLVDAAPLLRHFGNEDVSMGAWLVGLAADAAHEPRFCCPHCGEQSAAEPCVAVYQDACAGVCAPEETLPRLSQLCNATAGAQQWAASEALLRDAAAAALAKQAAR